jgi:hypothetical protein
MSDSRWETTYSAMTSHAQKKLSSVSKSATSPKSTHNDSPKSIQTESVKPATPKSTTSTQSDSPNLTIRESIISHIIIKCNASFDVCCSINLPYLLR